jgi:DNA-binding beta-propeller fold protein YncE
VYRITIATWVSSANILPTSFGVDGICIDALGENLYISNRDIGHAIMKYNLLSGVLTRIAGDGVEGWNDGPGLSARFSRCEELALSSDNNFLYVRDGGSYNIRMIELMSGTNTVTTISGNNAPPYGGYSFTFYGGIAYHPFRNSLFYVHNNINVSTTNRTIPIYFRCELDIR